MSMAWERCEDLEATQNLITHDGVQSENARYRLLTMYGSKRVAVRDLNPHILCALCGGYLIQATTVIECLHSFCRSCIVNFLETSKVCPICDAQIHKTRPLLNIRPDQTLQSLVYKLVPGLFQDEMRRRREFHATLSESDVEDLSLEERGEASLEKEFKPGDDHVSLVLQLAFREDKTKPFEIRDRRYLLCPSEVTVQHLKKFIRMKFQLNDKHKIEMYRAREELTDDLMLQDIALIYSWRGERPMHLCYTVSEIPRVKSQACLKQAESVSKQSDLCHTVVDSTSKKSTKSETSPKHSVSAYEEVFSPIIKTIPAVTVTPLSNIDLSGPTSASACMAPPPVLAPATSINSNTVITMESVRSVCNNVIKIPNKKLESMTDLPAVDDIKDVTPLLVNSVISELKTSSTTTIVSSSVASGNHTSKYKPVIAKNDVSKLMHSVESILNKTSKRTHHKNNSKSHPWTTVPELHVSSPSNIRKEKNDKPANKTTKQCKLEQHSSEIPKQSVDNDSKSSESCIQGVAGIQRSQSVVEAVSSVAEVDGHVLKPQDIVSNDYRDIGDGLLHAEDTSDVFSSYIPKFQKHRKLCAVKRSASYEGPSLTPVLVTTPCGDAMEKRNWKKRKLSTLDFHASKVTSGDGDNINGNCGVSTTRGNSLDNNQKKETLPHSQVSGSEPPLFDNVSLSTHQNSLRPELSCDQSLTFSQRDPKLLPSVSYLPFLLPQVGGTVSSAVQPQSNTSMSDVKVKSCSRKANLDSVTTSVSITKNNSRMSCESKYSDSAQINKVDKIKDVPNKKQSRVSDSDNESAITYFSKKSLGYIMNKSIKSGNSKRVSTPILGSANSRSVEEICVDISSSPSDVSNVTSPTSYVTSPGTEDRNDGSTLPEIQTSCDNNCVVTFSGKVVPLDLSSKQKK